MHNPPHPGEFITEIYLKPNNLSARELAGKLDVAASTLHRVLIGKSSVSPEMGSGYGRKELREVESIVQENLRNEWDEFCRGYIS